MKSGAVRASTDLLKNKKFSFLTKCENGMALAVT